MPLSSEGALSWQRLAVVNAHPRDARITFDEPTHKYTIDGSKYDISCTGFVHSFFGHFDADKVIANMMRGKNWKEGNKYWGKTPEEIKAGWDANGKAASEAGTRMHLDIEHYYNASPIGNMSEDEWEPCPGLEWDYFMKYETKFRIPGGYVPFRTEWLVFYEEIRLAGSIDMVYMKPDGTIAIYDWKRAKEIKTENPYQKGLDPLDHLPDTNYWHYTLQLNIYASVLEKKYDMKVSELALVILHPDQSSFRVMKLNRLEEEVEAVFAHRLKKMTA